YSVVAIWWALNGTPHGIPRACAGGKIRNITVPRTCDVGLIANQISAHDTDAKPTTHLKAKAVDDLVIPHRVNRQVPDLHVALDDLPGFVAVVLAFEGSGFQTVVSDPGAEHQHEAIVSFAPIASYFW